MTQIRLTHVGGPTMLIEVAGWTLLTDPTFDPPGKRYSFGWGTSSRKLVGPAVSVADLPPIDAVLLTHDGHGDNLDTAGRALLPAATRVLTTTAAAKRLRGNATGLRPWETTELAAPGRPTIEVTATPGRHGPPLSRPIVGPVVGFALRWDGQQHGPLWISGDTVAYPGLRKAAAGLHVGTAIVHVGGVRFPVSGPVRYTMTARQTVELVGLIGAHTVVPVHYEGWSHFRDGRDALTTALAAAPEQVRASVHWLALGEATAITA